MPGRQAFAVGSRTRSSLPFFRVHSFGIHKAVLGYTREPTGEGRSGSPCMYNIYVYIITHSLCIFLCTHTRTKIYNYSLSRHFFHSIAPGQAKNISSYIIIRGIFLRKTFSTIYFNYLLQGNAGKFQKEGKTTLCYRKRIRAKRG